MADTRKVLGPLHVDGTSQSARFQGALDPGYVSVDERSVEDLLAFTRELSKGLHYFGPDNQVDGDWSAFLPADLDLADVTAFMAAPERFDPGEHPLLFRPHFTLFLSFLELLRLAQAELNTITGRHLDFYYREALRLEARAAVPDRVHVLFDLAPGAPAARVPAGTLLNAGPDSQGVDRVYATDRDLVVGRARVACLSSLYVERSRTGLAQIRTLYRNDLEKTWLGMFQLALGTTPSGDLSPGSDLPAYPDGRDLNTGFVGHLGDFGALGAFAEESLKMTVSELYQVMRLKAQRAAADAEWQAINDLLEKAGQTRDPAFVLDRSQPRAFDANLAAALGGTPPSFDGLPEVETLGDLYDQRLRGDVQDFIRTVLFFTDLADFDALMQIKGRIDSEWAEINRLLGVPEPIADPADFDANLAAVLGPRGLSWPDGIATGAGDAANLDAYYTALVELEDYFSTTADELLFVAQVLKQQGLDQHGLGVAQFDEHEVDKATWSKVDGILTAAYREKVYARRRALLDATRVSDGPTAMIYQALGENPEPEVDESVLLGELAPYLQPADFTRLETAWQSEDWERVVRLVELAQRNREAFPEPLPIKEQWRDLYPAADATALVVTTGAPAETPRWQTFGAPNAGTPIAGTDPGTTSRAGWALSTPLLALAEGRRTLTLTLGFAAVGFESTELEQALKTDQALAVQASSATGWIEPSEVSATLGDYETLAGVAERPDLKGLKAVQLTLTFAEDAEAITALPADLGGLTDEAVLRLMLRRVWDDEEGRTTTRYTPFKSLRLAAVHLHVAVAALSSLALQNDQRVLDPKKPYEPFGRQPAVGSRFYLGHPELVTKRLEKLAFRVEWMGLPADMKEHYRNYGFEDDAGKLLDPGFTASVALVDKNVAREIAPAAALFVDAGSGPSLAVGDVGAKLRETGGSYAYAASSAPDPEAKPVDWQRYLRWELNAPDFQHGAWADLASAKAIEMSAAIANGEAVTATDYQVARPYTPTIKSLTVDYSSSLEILVDRSDGSDLSDSSDSSGGQVLLVHPFGWSDVEAERTSDGLPFVPRFDHEGELMIGLEGLFPPRSPRPPQTVALLVQMAEGSADPDLETATVEWSYLSGDRWIRLDDGHVRLDTTRGLINSGIVEIVLEAARPSKRLADVETANGAAGVLYWLRAAVARDTASLCDTVAIHTQAVSATFVDRGNAADHFDQPLPAETITGRLASIPEIAAVSQPYTSYGGRQAEAASHFNSRVSERLRHKQRALTQWDFERLVLDRFPEIYKVKCLPSSSAAEIGKVRLVVIPDLRDKLPFDPVGPKAPADLLADVTDFIVAKTPHTATIEVINAHYVRVKVRVAVRFKDGDGVDAKGRIDSKGDAYYKRLLGEELNRFLSPWAYDEGADITIGNKIFASSLVDFLDRRPYVDWLADLRLFKSDDGQNFYPVEAGDDEAGYAVAAGRSDGVLVAARDHEVDLIPETGYSEELLTGIGFMKTELDFVVA